MKSLQTAALLWLAPLVPALLADQQHPELVSIAIAPDPVDITSGAQQITITLEITDDDSGFAYGNLAIDNPSGGLAGGAFFDITNLVDGNANEGTYEVVVTVPEYAPPGTWEVFMNLTDENQNESPYSNLSGSGDGTFTVVNEGTVDANAPQLVSEILSQSSVDTSLGSQEVDFTIAYTDNLAGIAYAFIYVYEPGGDFRDDLLMFLGNGNRISGDSLEGTYMETLTLPQNSPEGDWTFLVYLIDKVGNSRFVDLEGMLSVTNEVTTPPGPVPTLASALDAVQFDWTTTTPGWLPQTEVSHDGYDAAASELIGDDEECAMETVVTGPGTLSFFWKVDSEQNADYLSVEVLDTSIYEDISGNVDWAQVTLQIPAGPHTVVWKYSKNGAVSEGEDRGWVDEVRFEGEADTGPPVLQALHVSPRVIDVSTVGDNGQEVLFTIEMTDDFNGVYQGLLEIYTPSGDLFDTRFFSYNEQISGDDLAGIYQVLMQVEQGADLGQWRTEVSLYEYDPEDGSLVYSVFYGGANDPFPLDGEEYFQVVDGSGGDGQAPVITEISISPAAADVSTGNDTLTATLRITDAGSGLDYGVVNVVSVNDHTTGGFFFNAADRISGDASDGVYSVSFSVPEHGAPGTWRLGLYLEDQAGNNREYPWQTPYPGTVDPTFEVVNTGIIDTGDPVVTAISISPKQVDTSSGPANVTVTVSLSDDVSGFQNSYLFFHNPSGTSVGGIFGELNASNRISGDDLTGTYQVQVTLPQGSVEGTWTVRAFVRDRTGRNQYYINGPAYPVPADAEFVIGSGPAPSLAEAFFTTYNLSGNDALLSADVDGDGRVNGVELMQGTHPGNRDAVPWFNLVRDATHLHLEFLIDPALTKTVNGNSLELRDGGGGAPLVVTGQTQTGQLAGSWTDVAPVHGSGNTWRVSVPLAAGPGFARLVFETPQ